MYERRHEPLLSRAQFLFRMLRSALVASAVVAVSLGIGVVGYHRLEKQPWVDALLNASMILGGMGPVDAVKTTAGKLFASGYALFSGIVFLSVAALLFAPLLHRIIHHFHFDMEDDPSGKTEAPNRE